MSSTTPLRPAPHARGTEVEDGLVVLDLRSERYLSLNKTGAVVWKTLEGGGDVAAAVAAVRARFAVDEARATEDVARLIDQLSDKGLLEPAP